MIFANSVSDAALDELLDTFSVGLPQRCDAQPFPQCHRSFDCCFGALYYPANQLEDILVESCQEVAAFPTLNGAGRKSEYYSHLYRLLGNDSGIEQQLKG